MGVQSGQQNIESFGLATQDYTGFILQPFTHNWKDRSVLNHSRKNESLKQQSTMSTH
jgi:hypothetical protein